MTLLRRESAADVDSLKANIQKIWDAGLPVIDDLHTTALSWSPQEKKARLIELLSELKPGITEILFHASVESEHFHLVTGTHASRQADTDALTDPDVKKLIASKGIITTTWRELKQRRARVKP